MGRTSLLVLIGSALISAACGARPGIVVGSKNFTEQLVLGEIIAGHLERRLGVPVTRTLSLGGTLLAHEALRSGAIDIYPEYTGTALTAVLKQPAVKDADEALAKVRAGYRQWRLEWLPPLGFNNGFAMVVPAALAREGGLRTISDAARRSAPWKLGVGYEFTQRPDGLQGLVREYGLRLDGDPVAMDLGLLYPALDSGKVEMAAASGTDGMLANAKYVVLEDDRHYFPPYQCAVVVREETMERFPGVRAALAELSGRISDSEMRRMNALVDGEHKQAAQVARDFLYSWK